MFEGFDCLVIALHWFRFCIIVFCSGVSRKGLEWFHAVSLLDRDDLCVSAMIICVFAVLLAHWEVGRHHFTFSCLCIFSLSLFLLLIFCFHGEVILPDLFSENHGFRCWMMDAGKEEQCEDACRDALFYPLHMSILVVVAIAAWGLVLSFSLCFLHVSVCPCWCYWCWWCFVFYFFLLFLCHFLQSLCFFWTSPDNYWIIIRTCDLLVVCHVCCCVLSFEAFCLALGLA